MEIDSNVFIGLNYENLMNTNSKLNTILLIIVIILLGTLVWVVASSKKSVENMDYNFPTSVDINQKNNDSLPVVTSPQLQIKDGWKEYTDSTNKFSIQYPENFINQGIQPGGFYTEINIPTLTIRFPNDYQKGTDYDGAFIELSVSPKTDKCFSSNYETENINLTRVINGTTFHYTEPVNDSAMGGVRGTSILMSAVKNGKCYRISKTYSYRDYLGLMEPPYPPHYDEQKIKDDLESIITTLIIN